MTVPFRTFALFGLAFGMLAAGYIFAPATGASPSLPAQPVAKRSDPAPDPQPQKVAQSKSAPALIAHRPPVPLVTQRRDTYFQQATVESQAVSQGSATPTINMGTFNTNPPDQNDRSQALLAAPSTDGAPGSAPPPGGDSKARRAIEFDGYRNVRDLTQGPDGVWRGRAMRGRTEIAVRVDASGNVSAE